MIDDVLEIQRDLPIRKRDYCTVKFSVWYKSRIAFRAIAPAACRRFLVFSLSPQNEGAKRTTAVRSRHISERGTMYVRYPPAVLRSTTSAESANAFPITMLNLNQVRVCVSL